MTDDIKLLAFDFAAASPTVLQLLMEDAPEPEIFRDILSANTGRSEVLQLLFESSAVTDEIREEARKLLSLPMKLKKIPVQREQQEVRKSNESRVSSRGCSRSWWGKR